MRSTTSGLPFVTASPHVGHVEGVLGVPRGVVLGHVQEGEVVAVVLHLGPLHHGEAEADEDPLHLPPELRHRVQQAPLVAPPGEGDVDPLRLQLPLPRPLPQRPLALGERRFEGPLDPVPRRPRGGALLGGQGPQAPQQLGQAPPAPQHLHPPLLEPLLVRGLGEPGQRLPLQRVQLIHQGRHRTHPPFPWLSVASGPRRGPRAHRAAAPAALAHRLEEEDAPRDRHVERLDPLHRDPHPHRPRRCTAPAEAPWASLETTTAVGPLQSTSQ